MSSLLNLTYRIVLFYLGADPKSVLCAFFKSGSCGKGNKCKFSHDLSLERKGEKRSVYVDERDQGKSGKIRCS